MANFDSSQLLNAVARPVVPGQVGRDEGNMQWKFGSLPAANGNAFAQNDTITLFTLPEGARPVHMVRTNGAFGGGVTLDVGIPGEVDRFEDGVSVAGATAFPVLTVCDDIEPLTADTPVFATLLGANPTDGVALTIGIGYVFD